MESTRYQALPGNADREALPPILFNTCEAEPLDMGSQAEPGNQFTRYQALPGNTDPEALPPIFLIAIRGRASRHRFPGRAGEPVKITNNK